MLNVKEYDETFRYTLLSRMQTDCEYYLNSGNRQAKHLWSGNEVQHIADMKALYNSFPEEKKPEWITMDDILRYKKEMIG